MIQDENGNLVDSPIHNWFGLSYSSYFTVPRMALEAMPIELQMRFVELMDEINATGIKTPSYIVLRDDQEFTRKVRCDDEDETSTVYEYHVLQADPWGNYRRPDKSLLPETVR